MNTARLYSRIDELGALLRAAGMAHGVDVWLSVARLLKQLEEQGKLPNDERDLAPLLGPLFCRNPEEQARFPVLFEQWLNRETQPALEAVNRIDAPGRDALLAAQAAVQKTQKHWVMGGIVVFVCLLAVLIVNWSDWFRPKPVEVPAKVEPPKPVQTAPPIVRRKPQPAPASVAIVDRIEPRRQPQPDYLRQDWQHVVRHIGWGLFALPWLPVFGYLAWRYRRNVVLRRQGESADDLLRHFHFDRVLQPFFGGAQAERMLRELHAARLEPTQRLHVSATVDATARNGGYFQPVYRNRRIAPEHVLLVRSQGRGDQQAALAEELEKRFKALGLSIKTYRFRDDPRWLVQWGDDNGQTKYYQLHQLAARHEGARLLIVSETAILFHPYSGEIRSWLDDFTPWRDKVWLQPRDASNAHAALLAQHRFLMLPLMQDNLPQLVEHLTKPQPQKLLPRLPQTLPLPALIAAEPDAWLGERPPYGADLPLLLRQLEQFLGTNGLRLLRAVAVYPKPHWSLTQALDYLLFGGLNTPTLTADPPQRREQRLARLSRLPWLTHAYLPDWLRELLLLDMDRHERVQVTEVWQRLFHQHTRRDSPQSLNLEVRIPSKLQLQVKFDDWRAISKDTAINDPIFANILRGGKLGLLDFRIPQALAKLLPKTKQSVILYPTLISIMLGLLGCVGLLLINLLLLQPRFINWGTFETQSWEQLNETGMDGIRDFAFSHGEKRFASIEEYELVKVFAFDEITEKFVLTHEIPSNDIAIYSIAISQDGKQLLRGGTDGNRPVLEIWLLSSNGHNSLIKMLNASGSSLFKHVAFSEDNKQIFAVTEEGVLVTWNGSTFEKNEIPLKENNGDPLYRAAFSLDRKILMTTSNSYSGIKLWKTETGECYKDSTGVCRIQRSHEQSSISGIAFSPDGKLAFSSSEASLWTLWDVASGDVIARKQYNPDQEERSERAYFRSDGKLLIFTWFEKWLLWDVMHSTSFRNVK